MSAAITTPPSNLSPRTEVPVTMGFLERGGLLRSGTGEKHEPASGAAGSVSDFPRLLSFSETFLRGSPLSRAPEVAPRLPRLQNHGGRRRPPCPSPCAGQAPRAYWVRVIGAPLPPDAGSQNLEWTEMPVKLPGD